MSGFKTSVQMDAEGADVADAMEALEAALKELDAAYIDIPEFRSEAEAALTQVNSLQNETHELQDQTVILQNKLEATRRAVTEAKTEEDDLTASLKEMQDDTTRTLAQTARTQEQCMQSSKVLADVRGRVAALESLKALGSDWSPDQVEQRGKLEEQLRRVGMEADNARGSVSQARHEVDMLLEHLEESGRARSSADKECHTLRGQIEDVRAQSLQLTREKERREGELKGTVEGNARLTKELAEKASSSEAGAKEVHAAQELLGREKKVVDSGLETVDGIRSRAKRLRMDLDIVMAANAGIAKDMAELQTSIEVNRSEEMRARKAGEKSGKLAELTQGKVREAQGKLAEAEAVVEETRKKVGELDLAALAKAQELEQAKTRLSDTKREAEVLEKGLGKAGDKVKAAQLAISFQTSTRKALQEQINGYRNSVQRLRLQLEEAVAERDRVVNGAADAEKAYFAAVEGLKLQELQATALQKGIDELNEKLQSQAQLYEVVKAERNQNSKSYSGMSETLAELQAQFKAINVRIDSLKSAIASKDTALVKEHFEHHRVEKEKAALKGELSRLAKAITSAEHVAGVQEGEVSKLNTIIGNAEEEATRQRAELGTVSSERQLLQTQLVKRNTELTAVYEQLRVQKSMLSNGAAAYARRIAERDALAAKVAALKGELLLAETSAADTTALEVECARLDEELRREELRQRAMLDAMDKPMNVHRWRGMADREPERWSLIQRVHGLQKRLLTVREEVRVKEEALGVKRREEEEVKAMLTRLPPPEDSRQTIVAIQAALKQKAGQAKELEEQVDAARAHCAELKRELTRLQEAQEALNAEWVRKQHKGGATRRKTGAAGTLSQAASRAILSLAAGAATAEGKEG